MSQTPYRLPPVVAKVLAEFEAANRRREEEAAQADPLTHKRSRVMANTAYLYYSAGRDGCGREVRFCWATHRNVAGFFLGWREVIGKRTAKRDMWTSRRVRTRVTELAARRANAFKVKMLKPGAQLLLVANEEEGWPQEKAELVAREPGGVLMVRVLSRTPDDPDGLREVTADQVMAL
jgi:hypothetical protein